MKRRRGGWAHSQFQHPLAFHHQRPVGGGHGLHPALLHRRRGLLEALRRCRREPGGQEHRDTAAACHGGTREVARLTEAGSSDWVSQPKQPPSLRSAASPTRLRDALRAPPAVPPAASYRPALQGHAQPSWPRLLRTAEGWLPRQPSAVSQRHRPALPADCLAENTQMTQCCLSNRLHPLRCLFV